MDLLICPATLNLVTRVTVYSFRDRPQNFFSFSLLHGKAVYVYAFLLLPREIDLSHALWVVLCPAVVSHLPVISRGWHLAGDNWVPTAMSWCRATSTITAALSSFFRAHYELICWLAISWEICNRSSYHCYISIYKSNNKSKLHSHQICSSFLPGLDLQTSVQRWRFNLQYSFYMAL